MNLRKSITGVGLRLLYAFLVIGLVRVPFPQIDYHNVRHHHAVGEVCPHHDHLLRWHPAASQNEDVALLHWHWFLPNAQDSGRDPGDEGSPRNPLSGTAIYAHLYDGIEPDWGGAPMIQASARSRFVSLADSEPTSRSLDLAATPEILDPWPPGAMRASFSDLSRELHAGPIALTQRRNC